MSYKKLLTIQDISCVGQCSLTVALPIISACGVETCILPSAVLSTHTAGFTGFTVRDLTDDIPGISAHWQKENIKFDGIYTGYLGSTKQVGFIKDIFDAWNCVKIVDPAMADGGKLYPAFDMEYVEAMKTLCAKADFLLPNITEAAFLTDSEYKTEYDKSYIAALLCKLEKLGAKTIVLTGVSFNKGKTGVIVRENGNDSYYEHELLEQSFHGTGDVYASAFTGALLRGHAPFEAAKIAADYAVESIKKTVGDENHKYGVKFELAIPELIESLSK